MESDLYYRIKIVLKYLLLAILLYYLVTTFGQATLTAWKTHKLIRAIASETHSERLTQSYLNKLYTARAPAAGAATDDVNLSVSSEGGKNVVVSAEFLIKKRLHSCCLLEFNYNFDSTTNPAQAVWTGNH